MQHLTTRRLSTMTAALSASLALGAGAHVTPASAATECITTKKLHVTFAAYNHTFASPSEAVGGIKGNGCWTWDRPQFTAGPGRCRANTQAASTRTVFAYDDVHYSHGDDRQAYAQCAKLATDAHGTIYQYTTFRNGAWSELRDAGPVTRHYAQLYKNPSEVQTAAFRTSWSLRFGKDPKVSPMLNASSITDPAKLTTSITAFCRDTRVKALGLWVRSEEISDAVRDANRNRIIATLNACTSRVVDTPPTNNTPAPPVNNTPTPPANQTPAPAPATPVGANVNYALQWGIFHTRFMGASVAGGSIVQYEILSRNFDKAAYQFSADAQTGRFTLKGLGKAVNLSFTFRAKSNQGVWSAPATINVYLRQNP